MAKQKTTEPHEHPESFAAAMQKIKQRKVEIQDHSGYATRLREINKQLTELKSEMESANVRECIVKDIGNASKSLSSAVGHLTWTPPEPKKLPCSCYYSYDPEKGPGVCAIDIDGPEDRSSRSRCHLIRREKGNMCRSDCDYWWGSEEQAVKYITHGKPLTKENTSPCGDMEHVYEYWK